MDVICPFSNPCSAASAATDGMPLHLVAVLVAIVFVVSFGMGFISGLGFSGNQRRAPVEPAPSPALNWRNARKDNLSP